MEPRIVFEDEWMVVVDKPAGMVTNTSQTASELTVQSWFNKKFPISKTQNSGEFYEKGGVVHRLDKDTSGLLVLAKTEEAYNKLKDQFLNRKVHKTYRALVHGRVIPEQGVISLPIVRNPKAWGKFTIGNDPSKTAITEWKVIEKYSVLNTQYSFLELRPLTGRTHQLRVHLKHLGYPIVSDPIYLGRKLLRGDLMWCLRLFLHASGLEIKHPGTSNLMVWESPLPIDLAQAVANLQPA